MSDKLSAQLERMQKDFESYKKEFGRDGRITSEEAAVLKSVGTKLAELKKKVQGRIGKIAAEGAREDPLQAKYAELGGDAELEKALAAEDKEFRAGTEAFRAHIKSWQEKRKKTLLARKKEMQEVASREQTLQAPMKAWYERESNAIQPIRAEVKSLGPKLQTEAGKELLHTVEERNEKIRQGKVALGYNQRTFGTARSVLRTIDVRLADVDAVYEALEQVIRNGRTEMDNRLQMKGMSLKDKVDFLSKNTASARAEVEAGIKQQLDDAIKESLQATESEEAKFEPPEEPSEFPAYDWKAVRNKIAELKAATLQDLQQADPELEKVRIKYEQAGGDEALFKKRVEAWKKGEAARKEQEKKWSEDFQKRQEELQEIASKAARNQERAQKKLEDLNTRIEQVEAGLAVLQAKEGAESLSGQQEAQKKLLARELERLRGETGDRDRVLRVADEAKRNALDLIEKERRHYEGLADDDPKSEFFKKPTSQDIHTMPLRAKYEELVAK